MLARDAFCSVASIFFALDVIVDQFREVLDGPECRLAFIFAFRGSRQHLLEVIAHLLPESLVRNSHRDFIESIDEISFIDPSLVLGENVLGGQENKVATMPRQSVRVILPGFGRIVEADFADWNLAAQRRCDVVEGKLLRVFK